jgi:hypothetical protein
MTAEVLHSACPSAFSYYTLVRAKSGMRSSYDGSMPCASCDEADAEKLCLNLTHGTRTAAFNSLEIMGGRGFHDLIIHPKIMTSHGNSESCSKSSAEYQKILSAAQCNQGDSRK